MSTAQPSIDSDHFATIMPFVRKSKYDMIRKGGMLPEPTVNVERGLVQFCRKERHFYVTA
jgi:hypothetical protein